MRYVIGIDEAGRGPLAGPVSVGAVLVAHDFDWAHIEGVRDSKKLSEKTRERIYERAIEMQEASCLRFAVAMSSATYIDSYGIVPAINRALAEVLTKLGSNPHDTRVLLDGSLKAPTKYIHQETIIRGDDSEPAISLASIMAKVTRDRLMKQLAPQYPSYGFDVHKGYGTLMHRKRIAEHGLSELHRTTFCTRILLPAQAGGVESDAKTDAFQEDRVVV